MSQVDGIYANHALLTIINDLVGKEVLVEAVDGAKYSGIFTACSPEFDIGLRHAYKITTGNMTNLLPKKEDMTTKMLFKFSDIVAMSALMNEEKVIRGFATDRDYHIKQQNGRLGDEEHELQEWSADEDAEEIEPLDQMPDQRQRYQRNNGWNVEEMFNTNSQMGVQSTYEEDLRQYTTAPVEGNEEDRRRADQIAREIENSQQSKFNARLENDDDERDLDKQTTEEDFEVQSKRGSGSGGQRGNFNVRNQRNGAGGPAMGNRRADVMKGGSDRRGGMTGRYPTQPHNVSSSQNRGMSSNKYEPRGRPSAQELQDSFNEFSINKEGNLRRDPSQGQTSRTYESKSQSSKVLLEPRTSASPRTTPTDVKQQPQAGAAARRADGLRGWNQEFNNNYRPEGKTDTPRESPARSLPAAPSGNAWARGPPTSVTNVHNSSQQATPTPASPSHAAETNATEPMPSSTNNDQSADASSTATESSPQTEGPSATAAASSAPSTGTQAASHEATPDSTAATNTSTEKEEGTKKFTFNINAPAFKPRSATAQLQQAQVGPPPGGPPQAMMGAVPMVPTGVPIQTAMPPPGMLPTMQTGQPPVLVQWQGAPGQQYQMPGYQYVVTGGQPVGMMPSQPIAMAGPRPGGPPAVAFQQGSRRQVMVPHTAAQWQPHVMQVGQGMVPYAYQSFSVQGGGSGGGSGGVVPPPPPQGGFTGPQAPPPQMMPGTPQAAAPPPGIYPQRFVPAQGYVLPQAGVQGQTRFPTPQQTPHQAMEAAHFQAQGAPGSAAASTGPNSQPPTPGPSPAQGGRGGSPGQQAGAMQQSVGPPPPQQFMAPASAAPPPHFYAAAQPVYGMYSAPTGQGMVVYGGPGGVPMAVPPAHHDAAMMQQQHQQQQQQQQQQGGGGVPPPPHQQYAMPHEGYGNFVQATPFYQQPPPSQMSRQNSAPQSIYQQQGPGAPPQQQQQQQQQAPPPNPSSTAPPQQQ
uniref:LsmAD domain-containing protein n=2 Tax=Haemonchus contortus TaxID=6289 RepID=A0A7I4YEZ4_HAECO